MHDPDKHDEEQTVPGAEHDITRSPDNVFYSDDGEDPLNYTSVEFPDRGRADSYYHYPR